MRWYSMCWLVGLALAYFLVRKLYIEQKVKDGLFDPLFIYCFIGILLGARLGHCLFYEPEYWLSSPQHVLEIFIPIRYMADGTWKFTGYEGLASHGGTIGLTVALIIYWLKVRKHGLGIWQILDNIAIATPITACFIRLGNLVNSEIIGKVTDVPWAFIFERVDMLPRLAGISIANTPSEWARASSSAFAWCSSSPSVSSSSTPKTYKWQRKQP